MSPEKYRKLKTSTASKLKNCLYYTLCCCFCEGTKQKFSFFSKLSKSKEIQDLLELLVVSDKPEDIAQLCKKPIYTPVVLNKMRQDLTFFIPQLA